jgi:glucose/arabinose dehydrogenase
MTRAPLAALLAIGLALPCPAAVGVRTVATGFERPVWAGAPAGAGGKLWVMEQAGRVWVVDLATSERRETPFLDLREEVSRRDNEEGLLGLAFAPDFAASGRYYVNFTDKERHTRIVRLTSDDRLTTDLGTAEVLMRYQQDFGNHNGGWIGFGPDGMLYVANGDGGSAHDPKDRAQDLSSPLGKMLRLDVSPDSGHKVPADNPFVRRRGVVPEIWAYGLRNPWRCSFDRETGDLWMGDVGQAAWEEINFIPAGKGSGANYGWRLREGEVATPTGDIGGPKPRGAVDPIYVYSHGQGDDQGISVTGGYVYRGPVAALRGRYVFGDYQNPRIWSIKQERGKATDFRDHTSEFQPAGGRIQLIAAFGEGSDGSLFIIDHTGPVYEVVAK